MSTVANPLPLLTAINFYLTHSNQFNSIAFLFV